MPRFADQARELFQTQATYYSGGRDSSDLFPSSCVFLPLVGIEYARLLNVFGLRYLAIWQAASVLSLSGDFVAFADQCL